MSKAAINTAIEQANEAFYEAFRDRDFDRMKRLWAVHLPVACIHPGMAPVVGRAGVLASWHGILQHPSSPRLSCSAVTVHHLGTSALVTCLEGAQGQLPKLVATNVFAQEDGHWRMTHHHGAVLLVPPKPSAPDRSLN